MVLGRGDDPPVARLYYGQSCLETLRLLPERSVHCVATSPPYWGLRDYKTEGQGWPEVTFVPMAGLPTMIIPAQVVSLGLEPDMWAFVGHLVEVLREVRRALRDDGVLWLNLGDSYSTGSSELSQKNLLGIPWRVAFALQADGWYLRSDVIWAKSACMPESVTDRPTRSHEYVFLLTKKERYFYDHHAIKEPLAGGSLLRLNQRTFDTQTGGAKDFAVTGQNASRSSRKALDNLKDALENGSAGRNKRTVWNVNPKGYAGAHFATWPEELVRPMILAGTSAHGACGTCGAPWERLVETCGSIPDLSQRTTSHYNTKEKYGFGGGNTGFDVLAAKMRQGQAGVRDVGWQPTCKCPQDTPLTRCTVLDPFSGSATTGAVAMQHGQDYIGLDLQDGYLPLAQARLEGRAAPNVGGEDAEAPIMDLFGC